MSPRPGYCSECRRLTLLEPGQTLCQTCKPPPPKGELATPEDLKHLGWPFARETAG